MADLIEETVFDGSGVPVAGALGYVYADGVLASLTNALGVPVSNPLVTDANGYATAYVSFSNSYSVKWNWGGRERYVSVHHADIGVRGLPTTIRQVATGTYLPENGGPNGNKQWMSRTVHYMRARGGVTALQVAFPNFYCQSSTSPGGAEIAVGGAATIKAAIEYPAFSGTLYPLTFSGATSGTIPDGSYLMSDSCSVSIPEGAMFQVRMFYTNSVGICWCSSTTDIVPAAQGGYTNFGASGVTDYSHSGTIPATSSGTNTQYAYYPCAIVGLSDTSAVAIVGDSVACHVGDTVDGSVLLGSIARTVGKELPVLNLATGGATTAGWTDSASYRTNRVALSAYAAHGVMQLGINSLMGGGGTAAATVMTNLGTIKGYMSSLQWWHTTKPPYGVTSTDSYVTTANQTVSGIDSNRTGFNTLVRALPSGWAGYFEIAKAVEDASASGKWKVLPGSVAVTADGTHPNQTGYYEIVRLQAINPGVFKK